MPLAYEGGRIFEETALAANATSLTIYNHKDSGGNSVRGFSVTYKTTGTLAGTFELQCCNDADQDASSTGVGWIPVNGVTWNTQPTSGGISDENSFATARHRFYRVVFTRSAGTGDLMMVANV